MKTASVSDVIDHQIETQGVSVIHVNDGHVFTFTTSILESMLEASRDSGKVMVFVKTQVSQ